jgi:mycofactocin precursor
VRITLASYRFPTVVTWVPSVAINPRGGGEVDRDKEELETEELLVEDVSIDGMCGVY